MNQRLIVIDGRTYNNVNEMPPEVRAKYEKAMNTLGHENRDSLPDTFETMSSTHVVTNSMKFIVDGNEYNSIESLPPEARAKYEQAMNKLDKNRNGIPDFVEGMLGSVSQTMPQQNIPITTSPNRSTPQPASPIISPDTSNGWMLVLGIGLLLMLCAVGVAGVWYFLIR